MPLEVIDTYKMEFGKQQHERTEELEKRRTLQRYNLETGEKKYAVSLSSQRLGLKGKLDMLVVQEKQYIPIELKYSTRNPGLNHKYQLVSYCLLVEEEYQASIRKGLIHLIPAKKTFEIEVTSNRRQKIKEIINEIKEIGEEEKMPAPTRDRGKCKDCEYQNFCGDV